MFGKMCRKACVKSPLEEQDEIMDSKSLKGTKTEANLWYAFAGESQAYTKYGYWASVAKKAGYEQIAAKFLETAGNEKEHAKVWFKYLNGIGDTAANLKAAAEGEHEEWTEMYKQFADEADAEGFKEIACRMRLVAAVEKRHEARYLAMLENLQNSTIFKKEEKKVWICRNCGHIHTGDTAPELCPTCLHPRAYFEIFCEEF